MKTAQQQQQQPDMEKFIPIIEKIKTGILMTTDDAGKIKGRPMAVTQIDEAGCLWFFTNEFSGKVADIHSHNEVVVAFAHPDENEYAIVQGTAAVVKDPKKMADLFNPLVKAWFPEGLEDPQLALLKITPTEVEYWTSTSNKIVWAAKMLAAWVKGETVKEGEHEIVKIS